MNTASPPEANVRDAITDQVQLWRYQQLRAAGFAPDEALLLARNPQVDLHDAVNLVRHGCSTALAVQILH